MSKIAAVSKPGIDAMKKVKWNCSSVSEMRNFPNRV